MTPDELKALSEGLQTDNPYRPRRLTKREWEQVKAAIPQYAMEIHNTGLFGFSLGFSLWERGSFPGLPPERLITVCQKQLPVPELREATYDKANPAYSEFFSLASTPKNLEALEALRLPKPRESSYYDY